MCIRDRAYCAWRAEQEGAPYRLLSEVEHQALRDARQRAAVSAEVESDPVMRFDGATLAHECGWNLNLALSLIHI